MLKRLKFEGRNYFVVGHTKTEQSDLMLGLISWGE